MQSELLILPPLYISLSSFDGDGNWREILPSHFPPPFPKTMQVFSDGSAFIYTGLLFALPSTGQDLGVDLELPHGLECTKDVWDLHWLQRLGEIIPNND